MSGILLFGMKELTERQREVIKFIHEGQKSGNTPTLFELANKLGVSSRQTVKDLLDAIAKKGYLVREPRRPRAILLKAEAIREIEKDSNFFKNTQLNLGLTFAQSSNAFQWHNPTNIVINQGVPSAELKQALIDSSSLISLADQKGGVKEEYTQVQLIAEKSNFDQLQSSTSEFLTTTYQNLVVSPIMPNIGSETGYLIIEGNTQYQIIWSGVNSGHYFSFGREYGYTTNVSIIDGGSEQLKLFSQSMDSSGVANLLLKFGKEKKSWSHYVDFPIYGAALKKDGEVIFWSRKTARDINDLRFLLLVDITGTDIIGRDDKVLFRDISCNFPRLASNSVY